jgi:hypothetical protein
MVASAVRTRSVLGGGGRIGELGVVEILMAMMAITTNSSIKVKALGACG